MNNYFVEGHLGSYYISGNDRESIEEYCEQCGDYDMVLFSFDDEEKDEPFKSFASYFTESMILSKKRISYLVNSYNESGVTVREAIGSIKDNVVFDTDNNKDIIKSLLDDGYIDKKTYDKLIKFLNEAMTKQLKFIDEFDCSKVNFKKEKAKAKRKKK